MKNTILLVDDETDILLTNCEYLEMNDYSVIKAESIKEAQEKLVLKPDLIVLDIMMADGSGLDFCKSIREYLTTPILFLSCLNETEQVIEGFKTGGDDYLTKPYRLDELAVRCAALLRRVEIDKKDMPGKIVTGSLTLNWLQRTVYLNSMEVVLQPKEFALLLYLVQNAGQGFTADELYSAVWGSIGSDDVRTVKAHIYNLRKKLNIDDNSPFSITMKNRKFYMWQTRNQINSKEI